jgi:HNH endonuclease
MTVSVEELRQRLEYDPETGVVCWRRKRGLVAGYIKKSGYREIEWRTSIKGKRKGRKVFYPLAHRVAWALATGAWPENEIDHRNGNRDDNRLANLRLATRAENAQNLAPHRKRPWEMMGVSKAPRCKNRWRADMSKRYLGTFGSAEEAHQAYLAAKAQRHSFQPQLRGG